MRNPARRNLGRHRSVKHVCVISTDRREHVTHLRLANAERPIEGLPGTVAVKGRENVVHGAGQRTKRKASLITATDFQRVTPTVPARPCTAEMRAW